MSMKTFEEFKKDVMVRAIDYAQGIEKAEAAFEYDDSEIDAIPAEITASDPERHCEIYIVEISTQRRKKGYKKFWPGTYRHAFIYDTEAQCFIKATVTGKKKIKWKRTKSQPKQPITLDNYEFYPGTHGVVGLHNAPPSGYNHPGYQGVGSMGFEDTSDSGTIIIDGHTFTKEQYDRYEAIQRSVDNALLMRGGGELTSEQAANYAKKIMCGVEYPYMPDLEFLSAYGKYLRGMDHEAAAEGMDEPMSEEDEIDWDEVQKSLAVDVQLMVDSGVTEEQAEELQADGKTTLGAYLELKANEAGFPLPELQVKAYWTGLKALLGQPTYSTAVTVESMDQYWELLLWEAQEGGSADFVGRDGNIQAVREGK